MKKILTVLAAASVLSGSVFSITASAATPQKRHLQPVHQDSTVDHSYIPFQSNQVFDTTVDRAVKFGPYIRANKKGELYLIGNAHRIGVSQKEYKSFQRGLALENDAIKNNYLTLETDNVGNITNLQPTKLLMDSLKSTFSNLKTQQSNDVFPGISAKFPKQNNIVSPNISVGFHWWGYGMRLTERETTSLIKAIGVGSAAGWVAAELSAAGYVTLPAAIPAGLIGAVLALGGAVIYFVDNGRGVTIGFTWMGRPKIYAN